MNIFEQMWFILTKYWDWILEGLTSTIILSIFGTFVGLFLGIFLAYGKAIKISPNSSIFTKIWKRIVKWVCNIYSTVIRGTPMMVQAMIFKYGCQGLGLNWNTVLPGVVVFDGWMIAGLVVITLNTAAYMGEIVKSGLNGVDVSQLEGARSLGLSNFQTSMLITLPQALRNSLPTIGNEWIVNIKDSSVLNVIGVTELFFMSNQAANKGYLFTATYIIIALIYLILTILASGILKLIENKFDGKKVKISLWHFKEGRAN